MIPARVHIVSPDMRGGLMNCNNMREMNATACPGKMGNIQPTKPTISKMIPSTNNKISMAIDLKTKITFSFEVPFDYLWSYSQCTGIIIQFH